METDQLENLGSGRPNEKKFKTANIQDRKFHGSPHLRLKKVRASPRQKIRQLLRDSIPVKEVGTLNKPRSKPENPLT